MNTQNNEWRLNSGFTMFSIENASVHLDVQSDNVLIGSELGGPGEWVSISEDDARELLELIKTALCEALDGNGLDLSKANAAAKNI